MSKGDYETYVVVIGQRHGRRYADRRVLNVPLALATGQYERLSALQLREALNDLAEEQQRRAPETSQPAVYDPFQSQIRRPS